MGIADKRACMPHDMIVLEGIQFKDGLDGEVSPGYDSSYCLPECNRTEYDIQVSVGTTDTDVLTRFMTRTGDDVGDVK